MSAVSIALDSYFLTYLQKTTIKVDERITNAVVALLRRGGNISIARDIDTGLSPRQLRRHFQYYIGESPKAFSKIIRFQKFLLAKPSVQSLKENRLYFDQGYYDQAHFIKDFKHLYGMTPGQALSSSPSDVIDS